MTRAQFEKEWQAKVIRPWSEQEAQHRFPEEQPKKDWFDFVKSQLWEMSDRAKDFIIDPEHFAIFGSWILESEAILTHITEKVLLK